MAKYVDSPDLYLRKGKKGYFWANKGYFRAFLRVAIYLPILLLGTLKTSYLELKRKVPNFSII